ncbi:MAG: glycosyltransferase, partial [Nitrosopumilaceae archaeon]
VLLTSHLLRHEFLDFVRRGKITLFLPNAVEGFYLPALEGMVMGTLVVCPDCVGNRSFCLDAYNCFQPEYNIESILKAVDKAAGLKPAEIEVIRKRASETVTEHDLMKERRSFQDILLDMPNLW